MSKGTRNPGNPWHKQASRVANKCRLGSFKDLAPRREGNAWRSAMQSRPLFLSAGHPEHVFTAVIVADPCHHE